MFTSGVGIGLNQDSFSAGVEAASKARERLGPQIPIIAFVFCSPEYSQEFVLKGIQSVISDAVPLVGASTAGEITAAGPTKKDAVVVQLLASDSIYCHIAYSTAAATDPERAGSELGQALMALAGNEPLKLICMFADGLTVNPAAIIRGLESATASSVPIVGGSAGDNGQFKQTFQYFNGQILSSAVVGVAFIGKLEFSIGVRHGWIPIGTPKIVTSSEGSVVHEIDHEPALAFYERYIGPEEAQRLSESTLGEIALSYPLGVRDDATGEMLLRAPFFVNDAGGITCGGEVPQGATVQLMIGSKEEAVVAAQQSAEQAYRSLGMKPVAALIFSCHVRNTLFSNKETASEEVLAVSNVIGTDVPIAGFYTYAEQAPLAGNTHNFKLCKTDTHNETLVTVLLAEAQP